ncbi:ElyC/SanA/YdcF family protein [Streptomyces sp. BE147]|uniref:SanA/YdcF family protein n=1 Tax=Streptomyces sp. BE147 TaxID=3002524 RepID=UPI002E7985E7|nr:ElyC/SanA/YdcF family protein [Streptomyces sp. BE147]MEE1738626.1 ElyC/SanA/YdcF family protein [Streptomyces sp. BE147]
MRGERGERLKWPERLKRRKEPEEREGLVRSEGPEEKPNREPERAGRPRRPFRLSLPRTLPSSLSLPLPRTRRAQRRVAQGLMLACVVAIAPATWMHTTADARVRTTADAPAREVAMVFGAGLWKGRPSPYLAHRLDAAAELYRTGKVKVVLVTGDNSRVEYDEPDAMRTYLTERGVPDARIVSDFAGFDTWDSCVRAKKIFGVDRAVLVSQGFHIRRAIALCQSAGIDAYGVGVDAKRDATWYYGGAREILAAGKAALDATFRPDPHFLGPEETGVAEALAAGRR